MIVWFRLEFDVCTAYVISVLYYYVIRTNNVWRTSNQGTLGTYSIKLVTFILPEGIALQYKISLHYSISVVASDSSMPRMRKGFNNE